jgi:hypothetical protein
MEINGLGQIDGPQPIRASHRISGIEPQTDVGSVFGVDQVQISPEAEMISRVHDLPEIRTERVDQIRAQIELGIYESDEKLNVAVGRLLDEIG